jgi:hypothetical protein
VRDQSVDEGGLPYRCRQSRMEPRTHLRVRVGAIAPGWHRLQYSYASPLPPRAAVGAPHPRHTPWYRRFTARAFSPVGS